MLHLLDGWLVVCEARQLIFQLIRFALTPPLHVCAQVVEIATLIVLGTALACPPFAWLLRACVLPKPGQGPSDATMDAGFLR